MDGLEFYVPFNSISVISGQWKGEHERLCTTRCRLGSERILQPLDPKLGALTARPRGHFLSTGDKRLSPVVGLNW